MMTISYCNALIYVLCLVTVFLEASTVFTANKSFHYTAYKSSWRLRVASRKFHNCGKTPACIFLTLEILLKKNKILDHFVKTYFTTLLKLRKMNNWLQARGWHKWFDSLVCMYIPKQS